LWGANLQDANLGRANLQDAALWEANLQDANLKDANLRGAQLVHEDGILTVAGLTVEQLAQAHIDEHTRLPRGMREALQAHLSAATLQ
jgi:hypothetical protein